MDVAATYDGDPAAKSYGEVISCYPAIKAIGNYRIAHKLIEIGVPLIPRIVSELAHSETGIDIHPGAKIGNYFTIDHGTGIVIGETCIIGNHVKLYQGVTLGALSTRSGQELAGVKRHPTICDNVTIYANSTVLGGETVIGNGVIIGGNAFITKSIPDYTKIIVKSPEMIFKNPRISSGKWEI
jgi:serine O-acetyltransferase